MLIEVNDPMGGTTIYDPAVHTSFREGEVIHYWLEGNDHDNAPTDIGVIQSIEINGYGVAHLVVRTNAATTVLLDWENTRKIYFPVS